MWVFGGFDSGMRQNSVITYDFTTNKWSKITTSGKGPQPRAGHSAVVHENKMYIFGGKDEDNEKQKDLWCLDLNTFVWEALDCGEDSI
jgi:N-acetylneuraminic acid mutarotase